ncbi:MAG: lipoprotein [Dysosmobacter sp.]
MKLWKRLTALCLSALVCVTLLTACGRKGIGRRPGISLRLRG